MDRPLSAEEAAILEFLLGAEFPGAAALRRQVPFARVVGRCACGCATVEMRVDASGAPAAAVLSRVPVEAFSATGLHGLLVFVDDGYLSGLEIWSVDDEGPPRVFPPPSSFEMPKATAS